MKHTETKNERESDSKGTFSSYFSTRQSKVMKRVMVLLMITLYLGFAGAQYTPTTNAGGDCNFVCSDPFIDPKDGQCYQMCCPENDQCKMPCELIPCKK